MKKTGQNLVSIITPVYNAEAFIKETIKTVQNQTYANWELILINDGSQDKSVEIIKKLQKNDDRIKLLQMDKNSGAALSRNKGIATASGKYLAFLDSDDLWEERKLEKQITFIKSKKCSFSFTGYEFANAHGVPNGKKVYIPASITYAQALKNTTIWTSTVMFDLDKIAKKAIYMPDIKSEDTATWWSILKHDHIAYGLNEILSYYRRTHGSLSSNKLVAIKRIWYLYRNIEKLSFVYSSYNFIYYAINATLRRT